MSFVDNITFGFRRRLPMIHQTERAECGLACLAMIACYFDAHTDLITLRSRFTMSLMGATLNDVMRVAAAIELSARPLKLELDDLGKLKLPCILHWNFNHFVVLKDVRRKQITIHDPNIGVLTLPWDVVSKSFTGVALELWPGAMFRPQKKPARVKLRHLLGNVSGLFSTCAQVLILAAALEMFALLGPFFLQWVIDNVIVSGDRALLTTLAIGFLLLMILQETVSAMRSWVLLYMGTTVAVQWRANLFAHLLRLPIEYFQKRHLGDVVSRFNATDQIQNTLTTSYIEAIIDGIMAVAMICMMCLYSRVLAAVAISAMLTYFLIRWLSYRPLRQASEAQIAHAARQQTHFLETVRGIKSIKLFQRQNERHAGWMALIVGQINAELRTDRILLLSRISNGLLFGLERILIIWLGASYVLEQNFSVGALMAFMAYKSQFVSRVAALVDKYFEVKLLQLQGERLADIVFAVPEDEAQLSRPFNSSTLACELEVRDLSFRYSEADPFILKGINLRIEAGESVAIIGPSGCGKTTLINVLLGVIPTTSGDIFVDSISIGRFGARGIRDLASTVSQDDVLFAGSIADNISFFDPHAERAWVEKCAELAKISDDINRFPMLYNTLIGDMGTVLSGGQKQRILLARALYKKPKVLILDEATSHLDVETERKVNSAIKSLCMTRIIVAHRPETIASADRVIVLNDGMVARDLSVNISG